MLGDGSSAGEADWINAIFARRIHYYERLVNVHDLIAEQVHTGLPFRAIVEKLRVANEEANAKEEANKELLLDEFYIVDNLVFGSAIGTLQANGRESDSQPIKWYVEQLAKRITGLEHCAPGLDTIRTHLAERPGLDHPTIPPPSTH